MKNIISGFNDLSFDEQEILSNLDSAAGQDAPNLTRQYYTDGKMVRTILGLWDFCSERKNVNFALMPEPCLRLQ